MDYGLIYIIIGFALGGVLKGATGAGAPIIAVPVIALFYDVPLAVAIFIVPNFLANIWQIRSHYADRLPGLVCCKIRVCAGTLGAAFGTMMLVSLSGETLKLVVAVAMLLYIGFRLLRPDWALSYRIGSMLSLPVGGLAGLSAGCHGNIGAHLHHLSQCDEAGARAIYLHYFGILHHHVGGADSHSISLWCFDF